MCNENNNNGVRLIQSVCLYVMCDQRSCLFLATEEKENESSNHHQGSQPNSDEKTDQDYHRSDEQVSICLEVSQDGQLRPLKRRYIRYGDGLLRPLKRKYIRYGDVSLLGHTGKIYKIGLEIYARGQDSVLDSLTKTIFLLPFVLYTGF